ncbi:MAG: polysaccharide biosynthesis C-terminal domain-containing protein [Nitrospiraceae bacterium]|nr:polysaccharide biosynthesis C-terminal domain-containing protein [Nitrospiraceae bacterium]
MAFFEKSSIINRAWRQSAIYAAGTFLLSVGQVALSPLLTRKLSVAEYGSYEILVVTYIALRTLLIIPFSSALVYGHCKRCNNEEDRKALLSVFFLISAMLSLFFVMSGMLIPHWPALLIGRGSIASSIGFLILGALALDVFVQIALGAFRASQQPVYYGIVALTQLIGTLGLSWLLVGCYAMGIKGVFEAMLISNLIADILVIPIFSHRLSCTLNSRKARPVIIYAITLMPINIANLILSISDRYFLKNFFGLKTVGLYALSYRIGSGISIFIVLPFLTAWPALIFSEKDSTRIGEYVGKAASNLWMVGMFFVSVGAAAAKPLLLLFGGKKFLSGAMIVPIVSIGTLFYGITQVFLSLAVTRGKIYLNMKVLIIAAIVALILNALMIPKYGMIGAALATSLSYAFGAALSYIYVRRLEPVKIESQKTLAFFFCGLLGAVAGRFVDGVSANSPLNFLMVVLLSATVYIISVKIIGIMPAMPFNIKR